MAYTRNLWASERLVYRAPETPGDDEFIFNLEVRSVDFTNSQVDLAKPQTRDKVKKGYQEYVMNKALIGVVICLKPSEAGAQPVPVGVCHLEPIEGQHIQHRHSRVGINIAPEHQSKGYGSEAIHWIINWGFESAGLHRIGIDALEYNDGAVRLYQKLGFKIEGRVREAWWQYGRWWDDINMGMLESEWREIKAKKEQQLEQ